MLTSIPIYRLLLDPYSYLLKYNAGIQIGELLKKLPNHNNVSHEKNIIGKDLKQKEKYYENQLLIESKAYCRTLLEDLDCLSNEYKKTLLENNLERIFEIFAIYRLPYFKLLVLEDLKVCNLFRGYLRRDIEKSESVDSLIKTLRAYTVQRKLVSCISKGL